MNSPQKLVLFLIIVYLIAAIGRNNRTLDDIKDQVDDLESQVEQMESRVQLVENISLY